MSVVLAVCATWAAALQANAACEASRARSTVSFAKTIAPMLEASCAVATCHIPDAPPPEDLILLPGVAYWHLVDMRSFEFGEMMRVEPGNPEGSYLIHKLRGTHLEAGGSGERMPFQLDPLTDEQIAAIAAWIRDCSPNN